MVALARAMLCRQSMKPAILVATLGTLLIGSSAHAGGYVTAGVGSGPALGGELDTYFDGEGHRSAKVGLGNRIGPLGVEVGVGGYGLHGTMPATGDEIDGSALSLAASLTGHVPLLLWLEGYGRLGLQRTWISASGPMADLSGSGYVMGVGLEMSVPLVLTDAALWLEVDRETVDLSQSGSTYEGTADTVMLGLRLGL